MNSIILRNIEYQNVRGTEKYLAEFPKELHYDEHVLPKIMEYCDNNFSTRAVIDFAEKLLQKGSTWIANADVFARMDMTTADAAQNGLLGEDIKELFDSDLVIEEFCYSLPPIQIEIPLDKLMTFENEVMSEEYDGFYWYQREYDDGLQKDLIDFLDRPADHINGLEELKKLIVNMGYMASVIREKHEYIEMEKDL